MLKDKEREREREREEEAMPKYGKWNVGSRSFY
jgi:hypothetical protein